MNDYITKIDNFIAPVAESAGCSLARVGGPVRDEILGRRVKDADYVAFGVDLATLGIHLKWFCRAEKATLSPLKLRDGRQAGWRVFKKGYGLIEIMLPRTERSTGPGHRDFEIVLDPDLNPAEDALRRDFTWNALYKFIAGPGFPDVPRISLTLSDGHGVSNVIDPTGRGLYDLQHKLVSTTYPHSFRDDPLRMLRALRFVSVLGYDLSTAAYEEMCEYAKAAHGLSQRYKARPEKLPTPGHKRYPGDYVPGVPEIEVASGTVLDEMSKLLMGDDCVKALRLMRDSGVMAVLFPELAPMIGFEQGSKYHDLTTDEHTFKALDAAAKADASLRVRWSLLFHDAGKPAVAWTGDDGRKHYYARGISEDHIDPYTGKLDLDHEEQGEYLWRQVAARMNTPKPLREDVATLIRHHMVPLQPRNAGVKVRRWRVQFGDELLHDLLVHRMCDCMGKQKVASAQVKQIKVLVEAQEAAKAAGVPAGVKDLAIGGRDLLELGVEGRQIGEILDKVLDEVVCQPDELRRSREWQLQRVEALA